jgi:crossover junction endodeoxyribonuclease RuvC
MREQVGDSPIILGIDPGTRIMGYAVLVADKKPRLLTLGTLSLEKIEDHPSRLYKIFERITQLAEGYHPTVLAIEAPFFGKNVKSMLMLGRAQGVAISAAVYKGMAVYEYSPRKIKQAVTGRGNASKEQVASLLSHIFGHDLTGEKLDATDALSVALCHSLQTIHGVIGKNAVSVKKGKKSSGKQSGWDKFIRENPDKIV